MSISWFILILIIILFETRHARVKGYMESNSTREGSYATDWYLQVVKEKEREKEQKRWGS